MRSLKQLIQKTIRLTFSKHDRCPNGSGLADTCLRRQTLHQRMSPFVLNTESHGRTRPFTSPSLPRPFVINERPSAATDRPSSLHVLPQHVKILQTRVDR